MSDLHVTEDQIRRLSAPDLGIEFHLPMAPLAPIAGAGTGIGPIGAAAFVIAPDHPLVATVEDLLTTWGGVIFTGPPGTSKTYFAQAIARHLATGDENLVRFVQFHPSYQYEDFVEGYVPESGSFVLRPKHLIEMCKWAEANPDRWVVVVIDELSRGEPGRIFGEALTYVEKTKRGMSFSLASGTMLNIPERLVFLCTMNPQDRGVDEVDAAFERRFAKIAMNPDRKLLEEFLDESGMDADLKARVIEFFLWANSNATTNPLGAMGHTFFLDISDVDDLNRLWEHQLRFLFDKAYQFDPDGLKEVNRRWAKVVGAAASSTGAGALEQEVSIGDAEEEDEEPAVEEGDDAGGSGA